jgi:DNA-binding LacI/PurR family transcriptional regulator
MTVDLPSYKRATSTDVAREAGVSRSTVSQILNGNDRFPPETQARVRLAAKTLNYRPSRAGRALVTGLSDIVVVVVPNATFGPHLQDSVDRITSASALSGMSVVVRFGRPHDESTLTSVTDLRPAAVLDMGVFDAAQRSRIAALGTHVVPHDLPADTTGDPDLVNLEIGRLQVTKLLESGAQQIIYASLSDGRLDPFGPNRLEGIRREVRALGLAAPRVINVPLTEAGAIEALAPIIDSRGDEQVGVCCYNDDVAIALIAATRSLGVTVPSQLALVGVDRSDIGQLISPRLTTVAIDQATLMDSFVKELAHLGQRAEALPSVPHTHDLAKLIHIVEGETA